MVGNYMDIDRLRRKAEQLALEDNLVGGKDSAGRSAEENQRLIHELHVHQLELEMQNDELRQLQEEMEKSKIRYFSLYDLAPVGYWTIDSRGNILEANYTMCRMLGLCREELVGRPVTRFVFPIDRDNFSLSRKLFTSTHVQHFEMRMVKADKSVLWTDWAATNAQWDDGEVVAQITVSDISRSKLAEEKNQELMREKDLLLKEVHHRIKNNMNTVYWWLTLQADTLPAEVAGELKDAAGRVQSMAMLYDKLYRTEGFAEVEVQSYVPALCQEIINHFPNCKSVRIRTRIDNFILPQQKMSPVGMLLNELLTNAMKHAFVGRESGLITITMTLKRSHVKMVIADDGVGLPEGIDFGETAGFGMYFVMMQVEQLHGSVEIERGQGTSFVVEFDLAPRAATG